VSALCCTPYAEAPNQLTRFVSKYADINITGLPFVSTVDSNFQDRFGTSDSFVFWDGSEGVFAYRRDITRMEGARRKLKIMAKQG